MTRVLAFGTFDGLHPGHLYYLRQAKRQGDELVVVVARDATVERTKGARPQHDETWRREQLLLVPEVDRAILGRLHDQQGIIHELQPKVICLGYDQEAFTQGLAERYPWVQILRLEPYHPEHYKSSLLRTG